MSTTISFTAATTAAVEPTLLRLDVRGAVEDNTDEPYRYAHLLATFSKVKYPALQPFEHIDAGSRALKHPDPRSFLANSNAIEMTPEFGLDVRGCNPAELTHDQKDQLALEVARRGVVVFRDQQDFIGRGAGFYTEWGRHFGPLHVHPTSGHPDGHHEAHLVYKEAKSRFKTDSITSTLRHSDCSFELQPAGLTSFFLLAQPKTGGDTLYSSLKATHTAVGSLRSKQGGIVRRDPIETIHPFVRRHPVTGEEALYVNKQFTRSIVGMKSEEFPNPISCSNSCTITSRGVGTIRSELNGSR
ncbi:hypothetical protein B0H19DRAFT_1369481 [Mycena capillaripes]|nr:hypothetical protein B0H19DRAFT_1369481 [Mycena capillaripes]